MKIKAQEIVIPALLFIAMFLLFDSCVKKDSTDQTNQTDQTIETDTTIDETVKDPESWVWKIEDTRLIQVDPKGEIIGTFDLTLGVTMTVNDTLVGGVVLDDPLSIYTNQLDCFDPLTFSYIVKGDEICFSDDTHEECIPLKDCQSFVWILQDGRICVYVKDDCFRIVRPNDPDLKPAK